MLSICASGATWGGEAAPDLLRDFADRLEAAVKTGTLKAVMALYQTNGVPALELQGEFGRWQSTLADDARGKLGFYGKEIATVPSAQGRLAWSQYVQGLTKRRVTHIGVFRFGRGVELTLPLVSTGGHLWIVPREQGSPRIDPSHGANQGQSVLSPATPAPPSSPSEG